MPSSKILLFSSVSFIAGIFLASFYEGVGRYLPALFIFGFCLAVSFAPIRTVLPAVLIFVFVGIGSFWFNLFNVRESSELSSFRGTVIDQPELREESAHFILSGGLLLVTERHAGYRYGDVLEIKGKIAPPEAFDGFDYPGYLAKRGIFLVAYQPELREESAHFILSGGLLLVTERHAGYRYGDVLEIKGKIAPPEAFDGFDYPGYLAKRGIFLVAYRPEVEVVGHKKLFGQAIVSFRERASDYLARSLPQPHSSIAAAIFLGEKREIPSEWQDRLSAAGVRHITAVSGLHVTVVAAIVSVLFAGLGKRRSLPFIASAIFLFVLMTGMQASAIRAGIMGGSLILAGIFGRMNSSSRSVVIAAALMLLFNPLLLRHDIGFQLSFLAVIGIIRFSPVIEARLLFLPPIVREVTAMNFSAYLFTLPAVIYHFGETSLVFPVTNLLIIPILHITMFLGLSFIVLSFISGTIALIALFPLWFFLTYLVGSVYFFAELPWSSVRLGSIGLPVVLISYLLLIIISGKKDADGIGSMQREGIFRGSPD